MPPPLDPPDRRCPACGGAFMRGHPGGALECVHAVPCALLRQEDATRANDFQRAATTGRHRFRRPATVAEVALLAALDYPAPVRETYVSYLSPGVRRRAWHNPSN